MIRTGTGLCSVQGPLHPGAVSNPGPAGVLPPGGAQALPLRQGPLCPATPKCAMSKGWICPPAAWARGSPPPWAWPWRASWTAKNYRVYALLGDGEIEEGQVWEAAMSAAKYHLDNLCAIVDVNGLQIDGATADVMPSEPLDKKCEAFGWHVIYCGRPRLSPPLSRGVGAGQAACEGTAHRPAGPHREGQGASPLWRTTPAGTARPPTTSSMSRPRRSCRPSLAELEVQVTWQRRSRPAPPMARHWPPWRRTTPSWWCWMPTCPAPP